MTTADSDRNEVGEKRAPPRPLRSLFQPRTVAVIGATERPESVGRSVLVNLTAAQFSGTIVGVNPKYATVLGLACFPSIGAVPQHVDLAVIATPAATVPQLIDACVAASVDAAVVVSGGFKEVGPAGAALEREVVTRARRGLRLLGPNCLGLMSPVTGLNATFAKTMALAGSIGFASQSGALCTAILDWSLAQGFGFSYFISVGSMADIGWADVIHFLGDDVKTQSILLYMESVGDARAFLSAARAIATSKPIIVLKAGRTAAGARAAASHTGALTGSDAVLDTAFERCGVLRVDTVGALFSMAGVLAKQPRPAGKRLAIVTNTGGAGVLATDALVAGGGEVAPLTTATLGALDAVLPAHWSHGNPVDVLGDATPERYGKALEVVAKDPNCDGLLVALAPLAITDAVQVAEQVRPYAKRHGKPILASWMGATDVAAGAAILERAGIPTFRYPDDAARVFNLMWRYDANIRALFEMSVTADGDAPERGQAQRLVASALEQGRTLLSERESKLLLEAYGIPTLPAIVATSSEAAVAAAQSLGFPVSIKVDSEIITQSDVPAARLGLENVARVRRAFAEITEAVRANEGAGAIVGVTVEKMIDERDAYELIFGSSIDPQFGPVLRLGKSGKLAEPFEERVIALPPLTTTLARHAIERTRIERSFCGTSGRRPVDVGALVRCLVRFSTLVVEQRRIKEIEMNPLLAGPSGAIVLGARIVLHPAEIADAALPSSAIRPYPSQYAAQWTSRDGTPMMIRPIRPEDEPAMRVFYDSLSKRSLYLRYAHAVKLAEYMSHDTLARRCFIDYALEMALVAETRMPSGDCGIVGVGTLAREYERAEAEFALLVADEYAGFGIGRELLCRLVEIGRVESISRIVGYILNENGPMLAVCRRLGFSIKRQVNDAMVIASIDPLSAASVSDAIDSSNDRCLDEMQPPLASTVFQIRSNVLD
jgi:acetyltransferase